LNSYSVDLEWTEIQSDTIVKYLKNSNIKDKNIYVEFMDTKKFPPTKERDAYLQLLICYMHQEVPTLLNLQPMKL
jgi:hypothetical protein